ncbi:MAG TPA: HlyD family secretion protein [Thermodesulfobacteriota bacterium]|nr:HlyD family secretion protein [Thermodesulfobacteriota bacterium]
MEEDEQKPNRRRRKIFAFILLPFLIIIGAVALYFYLQYEKTHISTDDAFVDGRIHIIASKVAGTVKALHVSDNQFVKKDTILLQIDPVDYDVSLKETQAALEMERSKLYQIRSTVATVKKQLAELAALLEFARANLELQEANYRLAEVQFKRQEVLFEKGVVPKDAYDKAKTTDEVAAAQVKAAKQSIKQLEASLETQATLIRQTESGIPPQGAQIQQKEAALKQKQLNLGYTRISAPTDGYVTKRTVEVGNQIQVGQPLMSIVPLGQFGIWITANYKETQLRLVKAGQKVKIRADTCPDKEFYGRVDSIMAGTGSVFTLLPPENATGNYVKVVQRIPVKIVLDEGTDPDHLLRIGMSVVPTILVHSK